MDSSIPTAKDAQVGKPSKDEQEIIMVDKSSALKGYSNKDYNIVISLDSYLEALDVMEAYERQKITTLVPWLLDKQILIQTWMKT